MDEALCDNRSNVTLRDNRGYKTPIMYRGTKLLNSRVRGETPSPVGSFFARPNSSGFTATLNKGVSA